MKRSKDTWSFTAQLAMVPQLYAQANKRNAGENRQDHRRRVALESKGRPSGVAKNGKIIVGAGKAAFLWHFAGNNIFARLIDEGHKVKAKISKKGMFV